MHIYSFQHHLNFSGKHSATLQLLCEDCSYIHLSVARYSFIQLSELEQRRMNEIAKASKRQQKDSNSGFLDWETTSFLNAPKTSGKTQYTMGTGSYFLKAPNTLGSGQYTMVYHEIWNYF